MNANQRVSFIRKALAYKHLEDAFFCEVKTGSTWGSNELLRLDAIALKKSWAHPHVTGYEIKVDRSDFKCDTKWPGYLPYCHQFYFACPKGLIKVEEVADPAGLVYIGETGCRFVKRAQVRPIEVSPELLYYLAICRLDSDRFSKERSTAALQDWLDEKENYGILDSRVKSKLSKMAAAILVETEKLRKERVALEQEKEHAASIQNFVADAFSIDLKGYNWEYKLKQILKQRVTSHNYNEVLAAARTAQQLLTVSVQRLEKIQTEPVLVSTS